MGLRALAAVTREFVRKTDEFVFQHQAQANLVVLLAVAVAIFGIVRVGFRLKPSEVEGFMLPGIWVRFERPYER